MPDDDDSGSPCRTRRRCCAQITGRAVRVSWQRLRIKGHEVAKMNIYVGAVLAGVREKIYHRILLD